jgi:hypothetical protein
MRAEFAAIELGFAKFPAFSGNAGKMVTVNSLATALSVSSLTLPASGTLATIESAETFTNKRFSLRVNALADASAITPNADTTDQANHTNTQALGTLTVNAPSGTPTNLQRLILRIKSTNAHTLAFDAIYRGSTDIPLPSGLSGSGKWDYLAFAYNSADSKWDLAGMVRGF